ncbi:MAG: MAPEG family protein [Novosphingobium sp.]
MFNAANPASILVPMLAIVVLTFVGFIRMAITRGAAVKAGHDPAYYKAHLGAPEPEATVAAVRHYGNLFEMPTLFYAACLTAFALLAVNKWTLIFAWVYVAARYLQSAIHMTYNNPSQRGGAFIVGVLCMLALWINLGLAICARL